MHKLGNSFLRNLDHIEALQFEFGIVQGEKSGFIQPVQSITPTGCFVLFENGGTMFLKEKNGDDVVELWEIAKKVGAKGME